MEKAARGCADRAFEPERPPRSMVWEIAGSLMDTMPVRTRSSAAQKLPLPYSPRFLVAFRKRQGDGRSSSFCGAIGVRHNGMRDYVVVEIRSLWQPDL